MEIKYRNQYTDGKGMSKVGSEWDREVKKRGKVK